MTCLSRLSVSAHGIREIFMCLWMAQPLCYSLILNVRIHKLNTRLYFCLNFSLSRRRGSTVLAENAHLLLVSSHIFVVTQHSEFLLSYSQSAASKALLISVLILYCQGTTRVLGRTNRSVGSRKFLLAPGQHS
jgi:hypothetical protein